jgi:hypothetical protein
MGCLPLASGVPFFDALVSHCLQLLSRRSNLQLQAILEQAVPELEHIVGAEAMASFQRINKLLEGYAPAEVRLLPHPPWGLKRRRTCSCRVPELQRFLVGT